MSYGVFWVLYSTLQNISLFIFWNVARTPTYSAKCVKQRLCKDFNRNISQAVFDINRIFSVHLCQQHWHMQLHDISQLNERLLYHLYWIFIKMIDMKQHSPELSFLIAPLKCQWIWCKGAQTFRYCWLHYVYFYELWLPVSSYFCYFALLLFCLQIFVLLSFYQVSSYSRVNEEFSSMHGPCDSYCNYFEWLHVVHPWCCALITFQIKSQASNPAI